MTRSRGFSLSGSTSCQRKPSSSPLRRPVPISRMKAARQRWPSRASPSQTRPAMSETTRSGLVGLGGCTSPSVSEAEFLLHQDRRHALGDQYAVDDKNVVRAARHPVDPARPLVLQRVTVLLNAPQPRLEVGNDLLAADDEDHVRSTRDQWTELAAAGGGDEKRPPVGYRVDTADNVFGRGSEHSHLAALHFPVHLVKTEADGLVASRAFDVFGYADGLQGSRSVVEHLSPIGEQLADPEPRLLTGIDNEGSDAVALQCFSGGGDALIGGEHGEL